MPTEELREWAHELADRVTAYLDEVERYPVLARVSPGELRAALPSSAPEAPEDFGAILRDFDELIMPAVTHWNHPSFHGYFAITGSAPGVLAEFLSAALNVNAMVWRSSPAATELEEHVVDWIRELLGLPSPLFGVIQDTASTSSLVALATARHRAYPEVRGEGLFGLPRGRLYISAESHSSIEKAGIALGFGQEGVRKIGTDQEFRMSVTELRSAIQADLADGIRPVAVVATIGTTSTTSVDPVDEIASITEEHGLWLHVDAAYAGAAAILPEYRGHFRGWERADSIVFNPHKWLFTPVDCSLLYTRHPELMKGAFSLTPEYLRTGETEALNLMDYGVALGRRFRALKLWFVLRYFGASGVRDRLRAHIALAREFRGWVDAADEWERVAPVPFSTVVFRYAPEGFTGDELDEMNLAVMEEVNRGGEAFFSHTRLRGRIALRLSVGNLRTRLAHLERSWELLTAAGERARRRD